MVAENHGWRVFASAEGVLGRRRQREALVAALVEAAEAGDRLVLVTPSPASRRAVEATAAEIRAAGVEVSRRALSELVPVVGFEGQLQTHPSHPSLAAEEGPDRSLLQRLAVAPQVSMVADERLPGSEAAPAVEVTGALLAARLGARQLELWGAAPGLFTADPERLPTARLLPVVGYDEAQEIVTSGPQTFHPRAVTLLRSQGIPLLLRWAADPQRGGTRIAPEGSGAPPPVKAVSLRRGVMLVSLASSGMWRRVGFLAEVFGRVSSHGLSVDLVSTSETNITLSLDPDGVGDAGRAASELQNLIADLADLGRAQLLGPCAALTLVGFPIRAALHRLASIFELFEDHKVHLMSLAEDDVNLTLVVDEEQGERLLHQVHELLVGRLRPGVLGPTWRELTERRRRQPRWPRPWWLRRREELLELARSRAPAYVYSREALAEARSQIGSLTAVDRVFYAMKACSFPEVLRDLHDAGLGFECVSPGEVRRVLELFPGIDPRRILFTPNFAPREDYAFGMESGAWMTLDNLDPLQLWPDLFAGRDLLVRLDPGHGGGHHPHVRTAGAQSKFGVPLFELDELTALVASAGARVVGLHAHAGSGVHDPESWARLGRLLGQAAARFPQAKIVDVGGGLGVPERLGEAPLDLAALDQALWAVKREHPGLDLWLEPGRFLVARAGVLLARVTQSKGKDGIRYVGVETGMNTLIRPALYGAYHEIVNLSRLDEPATELTDVVGPICETGDVLGSERLLPPCREGDVLLIANVGAYGAAMSSWYNLRPPAEELML